MRIVITLLAAAALMGCRPPKPPPEEVVEVLKYHEPLPEERLAPTSPALAVLFESKDYRLYRFHRNMHDELSSSVHTKDTAQRFSCSAAEQLTEFIGASRDMVNRGEIAAGGKLLRLTSATETQRLLDYLGDRQSELERHQAECALARAKEKSLQERKPTTRTKRK